MNKSSKTVLKGHSKDHNVRLAYRSDIDGLRAVAVLAVVIFHAFPKSLPGGFVGVDIFFVISGFLISSIIFRTLQRGDFSFAEFYAHRIKRIFPALILVLASCYAAGWFFLLPGELAQLGKHMLAGAGFVQNFVLKNEVGYFDVAAELKPLLHLWSLAIEEQFYLVYPLLIFFAWRRNWNVLRIILYIALFSFGLNVYKTMVGSASTFYSPQTRFWELLAGAILAYLQFNRQTTITDCLTRWVFHPAWCRTPPMPEVRAARLHDLLSFAGLSAVALGIVLIDKSRLFPGAWALLPVMGAFLLILAGPQAWVNRTILANRAMVFVGIISYPLYLWHWPLLSFAQIVATEVPPWEVRLGAVILSFVLAWATYQWVEKPIRFGKKTWIKTFVLSVLLAIVGSIGYFAMRNEGYTHRAEEFARIAKASSEWEYPGNMMPVKQEGLAYYYQPSGREKLTLFVGDSNMEQYAPRAVALIESDPANTNGAIFKTGGGCLPIPGMSQVTPGYAHCAALMQDALQIARSRPAVERVVLAGQWSNYLIDGFAMTQKFGVASPEYADALRKLDSYIRELKAMDKQVFLILNIPTGKQLDPKYIIKREPSTFPAVFTIRNEGVLRSDLESRYGQAQNDLASVATAAGATVIRPMDYLCTVTCPGLDADNEPLYKDLAHLRPSYVRNKAGFIDITLK